jgi:hypothetical protein
MRIHLHVQFLWVTPAATFPKNLFSAGKVCEDHDIGTNIDPKCLV